VDWLTNPEIWLAFLTLTVLEVVLGVDNVIFISILASKLPQVLLLDIVFSIDSVITAVGLIPYVPVMVAAILASAAVMLLASKGIYAFVNRHPTVRMLALSFLHRLHPGGRGHGGPHPQGVRLLRHGLRRLRGVAEPKGGA